jgi:hypothetical protein
MLKSDDIRARCGSVAPYPTCHIDHYGAITNNETGKKLPETKQKITPGKARNRTPFS